MISFRILYMDGFYSVNFATKTWLQSMSDSVGHLNYKLQISFAVVRKKIMLSYQVVSTTNITIIGWFSIVYFPYLVLNNYILVLEH